MKFKDLLNEKKLIDGTKADQKRVDVFVKKVEKELSELGLTYKKGKKDYDPDFIVKTVFGEWQITVHENWVATKFENAKLASQKLSNVNPHSGKMNFHGSGKMGLKDIQDWSFTNIDNVSTFEKSDVFDYNKEINNINSSMTSYEETISDMKDKFENIYRNASKNGDTEVANAVQDFIKKNFVDPFKFLANNLYKLGKVIKG